jgi:hypothetical protein
MFLNVLFHCAYRRKRKRTEITQTSGYVFWHPVAPYINLNTVLIFIRPCATQSISSSFDVSSFCLYFTTCFGLTGHHQVYKVCSRSLLCFPFDVLDAFGYFIQVMLRHVFVSNHVFLEASNTAKGKQSSLPKHILYT